MFALQKRRQVGRAARQAVVGRRRQHDGAAAAQQAFGRQRHRRAADAPGQQRQRCAGAGRDDHCVGQLLRAEGFGLLQAGQRFTAGQLPQRAAQLRRCAEAGIQRGGARAEQRQHGPAAAAQFPDLRQHRRKAAKAAAHGKHDRARFGSLVHHRITPPLAGLLAPAAYPARSGRSARPPWPGRSARAGPRQGPRARRALWRRRSRCRPARWPGQ